MILVRVAQQFGTSILLASMLAVCSAQKPVVKSSLPPRPFKSISQLGAEMQQGGIMSQKDYIRVANLGHKTYLTHRISETDFAWTLSLLKKSSNWLPRARAMTVLSEIQPMSSEQKVKVTLAIAPYINSSDPTEAVYAKSVQRSMQRY